MKKYIMIFYIFSLSFAGSAQLKETPNDIKESHIGFYGSAKTDKGFSFKYIPDKIGVQVTGVPVFSKDKRVFFSVGLSGLFILQESKVASVFSYLGGQYIESNVFEKSGRFNMGGGFGMNTKLSDSFDISTRGGYGLLNVTNSNTSGVFTAELGFNYKL